MHACNDVVLCENVHCLVTFCVFLVNEHKQTQAMYYLANELDQTGAWHRPSRMLLSAVSYMISTIIITC